MPVTRDIVAMYRGPGRVVRRLLDMGPREDRALAIAMIACAIVFVADTPRLAREAHISGQELNALLAGSLFAWVICMPLVLYFLAGLTHIVARIFGGSGNWFGARLSLFWALLASSPLILLNGLVAGFIGPGPTQTMTGLVWFGVFMWFWISGLIRAEGSSA
ncbi:YIP1 family protein [Ruegeria arenilitoris]|uniref:YIP1 family protein n=1 Tax=Ruegeria arenilitoris TaxID=1173585 RepID=UPI001481B512|nr:YIP1 family protein [Ruegeria arenilitoris]